MSFEPRRRIPGLDPEAERALVEVQTAIARECKRLEKSAERPRRRRTELVEEGTVLAKPGEVVRVQPGDEDVTVVLPEPSPASDGEDIVISFEGDGTAAGKVQVVPANGTCLLPGVQTLNAPGSYRFTSTGGGATPKPRSAVVPSSTSGPVAGTWSGPPPVTVDDLPPIDTDSLVENAVDNSILDDMPGNSVKVNSSSGTGDPTDLVVPTYSLLGRSGADITTVSVSPISVVGRQTTGDIASMSPPDNPTSDPILGSRPFRSNGTGTAVGFLSKTLQILPGINNNRFLGNISGISPSDFPESVDLAQLAQDLFGIGFDAATHNFKLSDIVDNHVLANISGATATPIPVPFSDLDSNSIIYVNVTKQFVRAALTGDVTAAQDDNATTIVADAVTNAKLADMPAGTVKGRQIDAGTGDPVNLVGSEIAEIIRWAFITTETVGGTLDNVALDMLTDQWRFTATATVNGVGGGTEGREFVIENAAASGSGVTVTIAHFATSSTIGNRFILPDNVSLLLLPSSCARFRYISTRWRCVGVTGTVAALRDGDKGDITVTVNGTTWTIDNDVVSDAKLRNSAALSVIGRSANSSGDPADIAAANDGEVLRRSGTTIGFGTIATAGLADASVTLAKMANLAAGTVIGRQIDAGTGVPVALVGSELAEIIRWANITTEATGGTFTNHALDTLTDVWNFTATSTITGVAGGTAGRWLRIYNGAAAGSGITVTINQFDGASSAGNRFLNRDAATIVLDPGGAATYFYEGSRWKNYGVTGASTLSDSDKGDITVSAAGKTWTIDNDVVSDAKLRNSAALSVIGRSANSTGDPADIAAANDGEVLRRSGTTLGFGTIATAGLADNSVTDGKLRDSAAVSVIGRAANSSGDPADIAAGANDRLLARTSNTLSFQQLTDGMVPTNTVGLTKLANIADNRVLGNVSGSTGAVTAIDLGSFNSTSIIYENTGKTFIRQALSGDVVALQNNNATTIQPDVVDNTKLANMAQATIKGRASGAGTGDPTDLSASQVATILGLSFSALLQINYSRTPDASISITPPAGATWFEVECLGGGGGGGGADADDVKEACAGSGGGAGGWFRHRRAIVSGNITGAIGGGGSGGSQTGGDGGDGDATFYTYNGSGHSAGGGSRGIGSATGPTGDGQLSFTAGGNGGSPDAGATERTDGGDGHPGMAFSVSANPNAACGGHGGASVMGGGGRGGVTSADSGTESGASGSALGSGGGGGARTSTGAASTGASGASGLEGYMKVTFWSGPVPTDASIS